MKTYTLILTLLFTVSFLVGQSFEAQVNTDSLLQGNYLDVTFTITNLDGKFEAPSFDDMTIISGPNSSSSIQIINGSKSSTTSYSYLLKPEELGQYYIKPAYLVCEDQTLETLPIKINVHPNPENIITQPKSKNQSFFFNFDIPSQKAPKPKEAPSSKSKRKLKKI